MKKLIILLVAVLTCITCVFAGCQTTKTGYSNNLSGLTGEVSSNGGSVVVKGDYVYFVNGIASHTEDNTYGEVVTGALLRVKTSDLAKASTVADVESVEKLDRVSAEVVIPSLFVAGDKTSGFYIYGDYVYYATPTTAKNKAGEVQNTKLDFVKTSLDGKSHTILKTVDDNKTVYRFVESNNVVYLIAKTVNDHSESVISIYNATENKEVYTTEAIADCIFTEGGNGLEVYYTRLAHNEELDEDEAFNDVYRVKVDGTDEKLLSGEGMMKMSDEAGSSNAGIGLTGVTYTLLKDTADTLYVKVSYVDTSITTVTRYYAVAKSDLVGANDASALKANFDKLVEINQGSANAASIFGASSHYESANCILYLDATYGLIKYDYTDTSANDGRTRLFYDEDLVGYTVKFWQDGYVYLTDANSNYFRVNYAALIDADTANDDVKVERVTYMATATDWYAPEVVGNYFISLYTAEPYDSMVFVADITAVSALDDEAIEKITAQEEAKVCGILNTCISVWTDSVKEHVEEHVGEMFSAEE